MGISLPKLKYIFAAMNPPTYMGAMPLDDALADRFAFILPFEGVRVSEISNILDVETYEDAPLVINRNGIKADSSFTRTIEKLKKKFKTKLKNSSEIKIKVLNLVHLWESVIGRNKYVSPRRWKIIYHNLVGIEVITGGLDLETFVETVKYSLPFKATSEYSENIENKIETLLEEVYYRSNPLSPKDEDPAFKFKSMIDLDGPINPFAIKDLNDFKAFVKKLLKLSDNWEEISSKENWVYLWIIRNLFESVTENDNEEFFGEILAEIPSLPPSLWGLLLISLKTAEKSDLRYHRDELAKVFIETILGG